MKNRNAPIAGASCADPAAAGRWHIVHTAPRMERMAARLLLKAGFTVHYPHFEAPVRHARRMVLDLRPLYPRYLFAAVRPGQSIWDIDHTPGVQSVVYRGADPILVPADVIEMEAARTDENGRLSEREVERLGLPTQSKAAFRHRFQPGEMVRLARGPFADFLGTVAALDDGATLRIWIRVFGRSASVRVAEADLVSEPVG